MSKLLSDALKSKNQVVRISNLYDYKIEPCTDCRYCKKNELECSIKDGATILLKKIENADVLIFGTPIYWAGPTAMMKLLVDRFRPYYVKKMLKGKKAILVLPAASGPSDCDLTIEMFKRTFNSLGIEYIDAFQAEAYDINDVKENTVLHNKIQEVITKLITSLKF